MGPLNKSKHLADYFVAVLSNSGALLSGTTKGFCSGSTPGVEKRALRLRQFSFTGIQPVMMNKSYRGC